MRPLVLALLVGCGPMYTPRHAQVMATCGWEPVEPDLASAYGPGHWPGEACVDQVLTDLSVDVDAFLASDGLTDPYGVMRGEPSRLASLLDAARVLAVLDVGAVRHAPHPLREVLAPVRRDTRGDALQALLYDWVSGQVGVTLPGQDETVWATFDPESGALTVDSVLDGVDGAAILVHEGRHGDGERHVPCTDDPDRACDHTPVGAYAVERAVHQAVARSTADTELAARQRVQAALCTARIEN